jgi:anti-sigma regulatory factor (Ser/Thr protein kinase)
MWTLPLALNKSKWFCGNSGRICGLRVYSGFWTNRMLEFALNAVRIALSADARQSTSALLDLIRRRPEWEKDACTIRARVQKSSSEESAFLCGVCLSKMTALNFGSEAIESFETSYGEISDNAFEHGCWEPNEAVEFELDITPSYVTVKVVNPKARQFDLLNILERAPLTIQANPAQRRGRGLLLVSELADTLESIEAQTGVKAVFFKNRVELVSTTVEGITVLDVKSGVHNPSLERRLTKVALNLNRADLVIDFRRWVAGTRAYWVVLNLDEAYRKYGRRLVAWLSNRSEVHLPEHLAAYSWDDIKLRLRAN